MKASGRSPLSCWPPRLAEMSRRVAPMPTDRMTRRRFPPVEGEEGTPATPPAPARRGLLLRESVDRGQAAF